jgi:3-methyladenine DNA glycosylase AlkD
MRDDLAADIRARVALTRERSTPELRKVRREVSRELRARSGLEVLQIAEALAQSGECPRWFAYELAHHHKDAMSRLSATWLHRLARGLSEWGEVDPFACYLLGPAWRDRRVSDEQIASWAKSKDRWRRRSAVVATVALNCTARGGNGDARRTLAVCDLVLGDRDDLVVKALSWALRELAVKEPARVREYLSEHEGELAARVVREVRSKLTTGLKSGRRAALPGETEKSARSRKRT